MWQGQNIVRDGFDRVQHRWLVLVEAGLAGSRKTRCGLDLTEDPSGVDRHLHDMRGDANGGVGGHATFGPRRSLRRAPSIRTSNSYFALITCEPMITEAASSLCSLSARSRLR